MTPTELLTTTSGVRRLRPAPQVRSARVARYAGLGEPPHVEDLAGEPDALIEALFASTAPKSAIPAIAVREIVENLVHADFEDATISIMDGGATIRISDHGPGIPNKENAFQPGFSTACERIRGLVRGVGSGLPIAAAAMDACGGALELEDNLGRGTVVTLTAPPVSEVERHRALDAAPTVSDVGRGLLAILVEIGPSTPVALATELGLSLALCGRELVLLEHRGLVSRAAHGACSLTDAGTDLLATLF